MISPLNYTLLPESEITEVTVENRDKGVLILLKKIGKGKNLSTKFSQ